MIGDRRTRKKDVVERMFRQKLTSEAIKKIQKRRRKEEKRNASLSHTSSGLSKTQSKTQSQLQPQKTQSEGTWWIYLSYLLLSSSTTLPLLLLLSLSRPFIDTTTIYDFLWTWPTTTTIGYITYTDNWIYISWDPFGILGYTGLDWLGLYFYYYCFCYIYTLFVIPPFRAFWHGCILLLFLLFTFFIFINFYLAFGQWRVAWLDRYIAIYHPTVHTIMESIVLLKTQANSLYQNATTLMVKRTRYHMI